MSDNSDDWFARYKFRQPLGRGGMGMIYLAENLQKDSSLCVVKQLILDEVEGADNTEAVRLFKREANLLGSLDHPGIVRMFDFHATPDKKYFLVMDYVPGKDLSAIIQKYGCFNSEASVEIGIQCCEILEYLHEHEPPVLYRDLKPSNMLLTPDGQIVFIDFGIARYFSPKSDATRVVSTGYSPPEQYFGRPEKRSDLYALGATLGELLTAVRPKALSVSAPRQLNDTVLKSLDDLVQRLTSHSPADRPESARLVRYELYRIYNQIHPDFVVPPEARVVQMRQKFSGKASSVKEPSSSQYNLKPMERHTRSNANRASTNSGNSHVKLRASGREGPSTASANESILWDGIKRILQLFKRDK